MRPRCCLRPTLPEITTSFVSFENRQFPNSSSYLPREPRTKTQGCPKDQKSWPNISNNQCPQFRRWVWAFESRRWFNARRVGCKIFWWFDHHLWDFHWRMLGSHVLEQIFGNRCTHLLTCRLSIRWTSFCFGLTFFTLWIEIKIEIYSIPLQTNLQI